MQGSSARLRPLQLSSITCVLLASVLAALFWWQSATVSTNHCMFFVWTSPLLSISKEFANSIRSQLLLDSLQKQ